jgi:hypothetical protein
MTELDEDWLSQASTRELLTAYTRILARLRAKDVVRSANAPAGDYAEKLVATALRGTQVENFAEKSYDVDTSEYGRVQVKARVVGDPPRSSQLGTSPFRSWDFAHAALVQLNAIDYTVRRAVLVPVELARSLARQRPHVRGEVLVMNAALMNIEGSIEITQLLREASVAV